jgi:hypothetical protein
MRLSFAVLCVPTCMIAFSRLTPQINGQSKSPRLSDGAPNLSGVWVNVGFKKLGGQPERLPSSGLPFQPGGAEFWNLKLNGDPGLLQFLDGKK